MNSFDGRAAAEEVIPVVKSYPGFGELVTGGSDATRVLLTALCMLNDPQVNQYLLDCKLRLSDRLTKTTIFPREGMALPNEPNQVGIPIHNQTSLGQGGPAFGVYGSEVSAEPSAPVVENQ